MQSRDIGYWQHPHDFITDDEARAERRTRWVVALTLVTMVIELTAGWLTGSMALLADGWHMGSHAAALGISAFAYSFARNRREDRRFTFGTGKVSTLAGYSSSLLLAAGALWMLVESVSRLLDPIAIRYGEAMLVAILGLIVNLASAWILGHQGHSHSHAREHGHHPRGDHQDHNLRAAYLHVLADALTSVLAIVALGFGMAFGWSFLDPIMGIAGAVLIGRWSWGLACDTARVLLDAEDHGEVASQVRDALERETDTRVADLHLWRVGTAGRACIVSLVTHRPKSVDHYRSLIDRVPGIVHLTVEVNHCKGDT